LRKAESVGRPVGSPEWLTDMEERTGLTLRPGKRGPKPKVKRKT
jgi:putative transposase